MLSLLTVALLLIVPSIASPTQPVKSTQTISSHPHHHLTLRSNQSFILGWQFTGSALNNDILDSACANMNQSGYANWGKEGLILFDIQEPICKDPTSIPNATAAVQHIIPYNTNIYTTLLQDAFSPINHASTIQTLCEKIGDVHLENFLVNTSLLTETICNNDPAVAINSNAQTNPSPNALEAYSHTSTLLYAYLYGSTAVSGSALNILCAHAPESIPGWDALHLNGTLVETTLCGFDGGTISVGRAKMALEVYTTEMFGIVLENLSDSDGWLRWLCGKLDGKRLYGIGVDGKKVRERICQAADCV